MIISTSGYYSTGSSAAFVLLKEYESCSAGKLDNWDIESHGYENIVMYTPNGLFDLEDKLLRGNSIHRSDEALRAFKEEMMRLNNNKYVWCGDLKRITGEGFEEAVNSFLNELVDYKVKSHWSNHYGDDKFSIKKVLGSIKRKICGRKIIGDFHKVSSYRCDEMIFYAFPKEEEFYKAGRGFFDSYERLISTDAQKKLILNHFILPHNMYRLNNYFGEDEIRVLVVDRDPRDVFVMEKYRTRSDHSRIPCDDVKEFVSFWKRLRETERKNDSKIVVRVQFEDLIYKYEETVSFIEKACGLNSKDHIAIGKYFSPEKSKMNTQLFKRSNVWDDEIKYIEKSLKEYLYDFPDDDILEKKLSQNQLGIYVC